MQVTFGIGLSTPFRTNITSCNGYNGCATCIDGEWFVHVMGQERVSGKLGVKRVQESKHLPLVPDNAVRQCVAPAASLDT